MGNKVRKIVLAYSGGLDTSVIIKWMKEKYDCEIIAFSADVGQGQELDPVREKALATGASKVYIEDLREEFVRDFVFPMLRANAFYEHNYLLGTSIARPLIAKEQIRIANMEGAGNGGSQKIVVLIKRIGPKHGKDKIPNKFLAQVFDINLAGPGCQGFLSNRIQLLALPHIGRKSDDFTIIFFLHPFDNDGGIQST
jgi:hypothetical protein